MDALGVSVIEIDGDPVTEPVADTLIVELLVGEPVTV